MLKDRSAIILSFFCIGIIVILLGIYARYLTPARQADYKLVPESKTKKSANPDITFNAFTVNIPSQDDFTICAKAETAKFYKQDQTIFLFNLNCISKKNNIFFGSIKAESATVQQQHNNVIFHQVQTELNLSSDTQQKP